jgi:hypothetical protein
VARTDAWLFRIGSGVVTFLAVSYGCHYAGRSLHEDYAEKLAHRESAYDQEKADALTLAHGYRDTKGYLEREGMLSHEEIAGAFATPHELETNARLIAGIAGLVVAAIMGETARIWAQKREAQRWLNRKR